MGWLGSGKKLSKRKFERMLRDVGSLNSSERRKVEKAFDEHRSGGLNKREIEKTLRDLRQENNDIGRDETKDIESRFRKKGFL